MTVLRRELLLAALALPSVALASGPAQDALSVARRLAARYPVNPTLSYISALNWSAQRRLGGALPASSQQAIAALRRATPPADWPQRAGYAVFAEAARHDGDTAAGALAVNALLGAIADTPEGPRFTGLRPWTDDMFMITFLADRALPLVPSTGRDRVVQALGGTLLALGAQLQRGDGLFDHAVGSPIAWGRGNGFGALALTHTLAGPLSPDSAAGRALLARLQANLRALLPLQGPDGLWRQVLDHAESRQELTATAMTLEALAIARTKAWLRGAEVDAAIARAWPAVLARLTEDDGFIDVCAGTPAGPTLDFYLQRPIVNGRDDRAAAMVLGAALALVG